MVLRIYAKTIKLRTMNVVKSGLHWKTAAYCSLSLPVVVIIYIYSLYLTDRRIKPVFLHSQNLPTAFLFNDYLL